MRKNKGKIDNIYLMNEETGKLQNIKLFNCKITDNIDKEIMSGVEMAIRPGIKCKTHKLKFTCI